MTFLTSAMMAPVARSRAAVTLNSSEKMSRRAGWLAKRERDCVLATSLTTPEGKSRLKKSLVHLAKSPYLLTQPVHPSG